MTSPAPHSSGFHPGLHRTSWVSRWTDLDSWIPPLQSDSSRFWTIPDGNVRPLHRIPPSWMASAPGAGAPSGDWGGASSSHCVVRSTGVFPYRSTGVFPCLRDPGPRGSAFFCVSGTLVIEKTSTQRRAQTLHLLDAKGARHVFHWTRELEAIRRRYPCKTT